MDALTLKERLDNLSPKEMGLLQYAFEHQFSQHIELPDKKFIGVNVHGIPHLNVLQSVGNWCYGEIKG